MTKEQPQPKLMAGTKEKIRKIVKNYCEVFGEELELFKKSFSIREDLKADKWGTVIGADFLERNLGEYPETLHAMFLAKMTPEEYVSLNTKKGYRWFYNEFKIFRYTKEV